MRRTMAVLLAALTAGCGAGSSSAPAPSRIELFRLDGAELLSPDRAPPIEPVFDEGFDHGLDDWFVITDPDRPLERSRTSLQVSTTVEAGDSMLTLSGRRGAVYRLVEVRPDTCYRVACRVRARELVPASTPFNGGLPYVAELVRSGTPEEVLANGIDEAVVVRHLFETSAGTRGWQQRACVFRTGHETKALLVACVLGLSEEVASGAVDFDAVRLREVEPWFLWEDLLRRETDAYRSGERVPAGWRARRQVRATLGGEVRPSIVLLPGEALRFELRLPSGAPRFEAGLGNWRPGVFEEVLGAGAFRLSVDEHAAWSSLMQGPVASEWVQVSGCDLSEWAGEDVTLELSYRGASPGVIGAPRIRDAGAEPVQENLIVLSIDTLRADRVSCYGYAGDTTPNIDALAREGVLVRDVEAQAPYTLPSHVSMLTGQFPSVHGVERGEEVVSTVRSPVLAEELSKRGWLTQAFTGGGFLNADFGFDKGFDGLDNGDALRRDPERIHAWLEEHRDEPFFLFLHTYEVHDYDPPEGYLRCREEGCTSEISDFRDYRLGFRYVDRGRTRVPIAPADRAHLDHRYDGALRHVDHELGRILDRLHELGIRGRTIVAVTSDHGEELFERGFLQHGKTVYEEVTRVPLVLSMPGVSPRVIEEPAMLVDLAPTLFARLGVPRDSRMQGVDLLGEEAGPRIQWCEVNDTFACKVALRDPSGWKLIQGPLDADVVFPNRDEWELYRLTEDPGELHDLSDTEPDVLERLRARLVERRADARKLGAGLGAVGSGEIDPSTLEQLRALGYVE